SSRTFSTWPGASWGCPSRIASDCADCTKPRARSVYFSKFICHPFPERPSPPEARRARRDPRAFSEAPAFVQVVWPFRHNKGDPAEPARGPGIDLRGFGGTPVSRESHMPRDPRSEAEKARADLARNTEM